ncbi:ribosomal L7Ae/L30e/S12e/Gadd45 family protein [Cohnella sp. REN36]|uniref:L7Ae/L30e/S12e/Gadd45 family ribosomal protein n=1 Tax=Cohnella sp. REN36 TaxID=2887347 RepID=UPI001D14521C|nr:ribosomal L7Ae/L30e/S12e/Gadd45 family protein [Cohnella sp. REN36]MCC3376192.1 ribosomal L7Ae/L30e/S12e/Gadd45 family protein [Cohnella sp. REN36]
MTTNKALSRLGLAMRAGKLVSGDETVLKAIRAGEARLVLVAEDASDNTRKKVADKCESYGVPLLIGYSRYELGGAVGKPERVLFAVTDPGFAKLIREGFVQHSEVENIE